VTLADGELWKTFLGVSLSLAESAAVRSFLVAILAVFVSPSLADWVTQQTPRRRRLAFLAAMAPFFAPELIVGYCYSSGVFSLTHLPFANTAVYFLLVLLKTMPVAMLTVLYVPEPPVSASAFHCHRLLQHRVRAWQAAAFWIRGPFHKRLPVFSISFLIAFQEFEMASLMSIPSWTVELFDAQAKGIRPLATAQLLTIPFLTILAAVIPTVAILARESPRATLRSEGHSEWSSRFGGGVVLFANLFLWGIPAWAIGASGLSHVTVLTRNTVVLRGFTREISSAMAFAFCGALVAVFAAHFLTERWRSGNSRWTKATTIALLVPGLAGSLAVSLVVFLAIQQPFLIWLRSTPVPAVFGIAVFLLPRAVLMLLLFRISRPGTAVGIADLLSQSREVTQASSGFRLLWQLERRAVFWTFAAVFFWGYFNLTTASLLVPLAIVPLPAQLYNLMHYGRTMSLSTQALLSVVVPVLLICLGALSMPRIERLLSGQRVVSHQERRK
jgi:iron(III) transport system permease protein